MSKLLTEPRIPKAITERKPRKKKTKPDPDSKVEVKFTVIRESEKTQVNELYRVYKENPHHARVKFFNDTRGTYYFERSVLFEFPNGDFEICKFQVNYGISITNRIYSSQKKLYSITYKKGKFYYFNNVRKTIRPLTFGLLQSFISDTENIHISSHIRYRRSFTDSSDGHENYMKKSKIYNFFYNKFPWIRTLNEHTVSYAVNLNVLLTKKLFGGKDISRHVMKVPNNIATLVLNSGTFSNLRGDGDKPLKTWYEMIKVLDHIDHLKPELLEDFLFTDTCKMARTLGRKINCKWGAKRLKDAHDTWSREITNIVLDCELEFDLEVRPHYKAFAEFSGYHLLTTNKDLLREGMLQDHCVGTYIDRVKRGSCAIFHVKGYTLQVGIEIIKDKPNIVHISENERRWENVYVNNPKLTYLQFKGLRNCDPPQELIDEVKAKMQEFSDSKLKEVMLDNGINKDHLKNSIEQFGGDIMEVREVAHDPFEENDFGYEVHPDNLPF